jgi:hypothetical protein
MTRLGGRVGQKILLSHGDHGYIKITYILGYSGFDFFLQNEASQTGNGCKIGFQDTFISYVFRFFQPFRPCLALKLAKSADISKKIWCKTSVNAKFDAECEFNDKMQKNLPKRSSRPKTFAHSNKSKKFNFSVTFPLKNFCRLRFSQLFQRIQNQHQILRFLTHIAVLRNKIFSD